MKQGGGACSGTHQWTPWSMLLNVSSHMKHEFIWLMGGDLNCFRDIKPFMK